MKKWFDKLTMTTTALKNEKRNGRFAAIPFFILVNVATCHGELVEP